MAYDRPMFATLAGGYPGGESTDLAARLRRILDDQQEAGLALLTDGSVRWADPFAELGAALVRPGATRAHRDGPLTVDAWSAAQEAAGDLPVKQCLPGPFTLGRRLAPDPASVDALTQSLADALADELADLAAAGCVFIQVDEPDAVAIGADPDERRRFVEAHHRLLAGRGSSAAGGSDSGSAGSGGSHVSLAIVGGSADGAGTETIFAPVYDSHLFDLIDGSDNWRLITRAPPERGIVVGALDIRPGSDDDAALLVWAIGYAASSGRGETRVGLAPSGDLRALPIEAARAKLAVLGEVARLIERRDEEPIAAGLDPRAVDKRSAALGRWRAHAPDLGDRDG